MSENPLSGPIEPEEHQADETLESEETGAHYGPDGSVQTTPEDEWLLEEVEEEA